MTTVDLARSPVALWLWGWCGAGRASWGRAEHAVTHRPALPLPARGPGRTRAEPAARDGCLSARHRHGWPSSAPLLVPAPPGRNDVDVQPGRGSPASYRPPTTPCLRSSSLSVTSPLAHCKARPAPMRSLLPDGVSCSPTLEPRSCSDTLLTTEKILTREDLSSLWSHGLQPLCSVRLPSVNY